MEFPERRRRAAHVGKERPLRLLASVWFLFVFLSSGHNSEQDLSSSSHDVRSYHTTQMFEWMPAGSGLWWELQVMSCGTRCEHRLPKGRQINYSAWSFASAQLRWQHMRGINLFNIHERTRRDVSKPWIEGEVLICMWSGKSRLIMEELLFANAICNVISLYSICMGWWNYNKAKNYGALALYLVDFVDKMHCFLSQFGLLWSVESYFNAKRCPS